MATYCLTFASELDAPLDTVWQAVGTMKGVNRELGPWIRMTAPREAENLRLEDAQLDTPLLASWILFRGIIPVDRHFLVLSRVCRDRSSGHGFVENSTSWAQRKWRHERNVSERGPTACTVCDRLTFTPRLGLSGVAVKPIIDAVFRHRHRMLRARFGGSEASEARGYFNDEDSSA